MREIRDLSGENFGDLIVDSFSHRGGGRTFWNLSCVNCGSHYVKASNNLLNPCSRNRCMICLHKSKG